jgi:WD40 repeat protein
MLEKLRYVFALLILCFGVLTTAAQNDSRDPSDAIMGLSVHPTLPHYAIVRQSGNIEIFNYETSALVEVFSITIPFQDEAEDPLGFKVQAIEYSPDGTRLAVSVSDTFSSGLISIIDLQTKQIRRAHNEVALRRINDMSWNPDGTKLVLALQSGTVDQLVVSSIEILDVTTGEIEVSLVERSSINNETASSVDWWRSDVIAYAIGKNLVFWDEVTGNQKMSIEVENEILDIAWSPQGDRIAMLSVDGTIRIWKVAANNITLLDAWSPVTPNFFSRAMTWIDDSILAVNRWTNIEIWNAAEPDCIQLIETEHFIFGIGTLPGGQIVYAGPNEVVAVDLDQLGDCVVTETIDNS